ncbi:c-type cytochrome [Alicycliphilus denitrificans]|uniref:c-type cytochrome n=1 Tax=Alicycliphilus denitrificans TaxID=179636 RepID=UPI00384F94B1
MTWGARLCRALACGLPLAAAAAPPVQGAPDADRLARGAQVYARCAACHAIEGNRTGPQHCGLFGRRAGTAPGFDGYTDALRASGIVWDARTLDRFLKDPPATVPGTAMGYAGVKDDGERAALIAWLREATRPGVSCTLR